MPGVYRDAATAASGSDAAGIRRLERDGEEDERSEEPERGFGGGRHVEEHSGGAGERQFPAAVPAASGGGREARRARAQVVNAPRPSSVRTVSLTRVSEVG
jgi:hypothetical protein